jgi:hypothetical protein
VLVPDRVLRAARPPLYPPACSQNLVLNPPFLSCPSFSSPPRSTDRYSAYGVFSQISD